MSVTVLDTQATRLGRIVVGCFAGFLVLVTLLLLPAAPGLGPQLPAALPGSAVALALVELTISYLLFGQALIAGMPVIAALASAYMFAGLGVGLQLLAMPGIVSPDGLLEGGASAAVWVWGFRHSGFAVLVIVYALLLRRNGGRTGSPGTAMVAVACGMIGAIVLAALAAVAAVMLAARHPEFSPPDIYLKFTRAGYGSAVWAVGAVALAILLRVSWGRGIAHTWIAVSVLAGFLDVTLTEAGHSGFTLGWGVAQAVSIAAALAVLCALLRESVVLTKRISDLNVELTRVAAVDGLTGVANRRYFDDRYRAEWRRSKREAESVALMMIDIDHFKGFNDHYGHLAGDECIRAVAQAIAAVAKRPGDVVARYGGEEFAVILPRTAIEGAVEVAERIRRIVFERAIPHMASNAAPVVTVSIGVGSIVPQRDDVPNLLIEAADKALYRAKRSGRNRVAQAEPIEGEPAQLASLEGLQVSN
jgi:diguanylate cyclase (GGDEF)-like protein